jgi:hypothetical protein
MSTHKFPMQPAVEIVEQLNALSRQPFRDVLARFLGCAPTAEAIAAQAERYPDRWAQCVALLARLSGYNEHLEIEGTYVHKGETLSDAAVLARIAELERKLVDTQSNGNSQDSEQ